MVREGMNDRVFNREGSYTNEEIYPRFVHMATGSGYVGTGHSFFVVDESSSFNFNYADYLIQGQEMKIIFQTGKCSGMEFGCIFDNALRKFTLVSREDNGITYPNMKVRPVMGDYFIVANVALPSEYIKNNSNFTGAEWDLFKAAAKAFYGDIIENTDIVVEIDPIWADKNWDILHLNERLRVGSVITIKDNDMISSGGLPFRIESVKTNINNEKIRKIDVKPFTRRTETITCSVS